MQGGIQKVLSHGGVLKNAVLQHIRLVNPVVRPLLFPRYESVASARMEEHGFESTTIADILKAKGKSADGSWLWCATEDTVYDAVKSVCNNLLYISQVCPFFYSAICRNASFWYVTSCFTLIFFCVYSRLYEKHLMLRAPKS